MTRLAESLTRLRKKWADDPSIYVSNGIKLPENVKYTSLNAAKILANIAFPAHAPMVFMWVDVSNRVSKCGACEQPIPPQSDRIACHSILQQGRRLRNGGWKGSERSYYHPSCFDDALVTGDSVRTRRSCFDCGAEPPSHAGEWDDRIWVGSYYSWGRICLDCRVSKFWYECLGCKILYKRKQVEEAHVDVADVVRDIPPPDAGGHWWLCTRCHERYGYRTCDEVAAQRALMEAERVKYLEYIAALARGEKPEHPWGGVLEDEEDDLRRKF